MWLLMAVLSAFFAGVTAVLAKCGIKKTDSDLATALRTVVVLVFSWLMVFVVGSQDTIGRIAPRSLLFLVLSGLATGASWLCYFKALSIADVNKVAPIDKSSTILTVLIAIVCFSETEHLAVKLTGTALLAVGIYLMVERKAVTGGKASGGRWLVYAVFSASLRGAHVHTGQCRHRGHRVQPRHGDTHGRGAHHGLGGRLCKRQAGPGSGRSTGARRSLSLSPA